MTERERMSASGQKRSENSEPRVDGAESARPHESPSRLPHSFSTPPPDHTEALYYEGMAAYQHRDWEAALDRFSQLKKLQPNRPGLDALLDEVRWFLQLQAAAPGGVPNGQSLQPDTPPAAARRTMPRRRWQTWGLMLLGVIGITALLLIAFQGRLPWTNAAEREAQELLSRGQARLNVGDYEGAQAAFERLLTISPGDLEAQLGFSRAERQQTLAQGYAAAEAAIAEEDWDTAAAELDKILAVESSYADAQAKADFVAQRRRLAKLYDDGSRLYDLGSWEDAIVQFERIRELDNAYRTEAVTEFLFVCYLNAGQALIDSADGHVTPIRQAVEYFSSALAIHPRNRPAADARRLGSLYLDAISALSKGNVADAQAVLKVLLAEAPTYANGQAAQQLYALLIDQAEVALQGGDVPAAIGFYENAQTVAVSDQTAAIEGEAYARSITPTPMPSPTSPPRPTALPATPTPHVVVRTGVLNVRSGPGTAYPTIGQVRISDSLAVTGRNADSNWLYVCCIDTQPGWIAAGLVEIQGAVDAVTVVTPPSTPPATATAVGPSPTPTGQLICIEGKLRDTSGGQPLIGWTVMLNLPDGAARSQQTDEEGAFRFTGLIAGAHTVSEQVKSGWRAVSPAANTLVLGPASACQVVDFWNERGAPAGSSPSQPTSPPPKPTPPR